MNFKQLCLLLYVVLPVACQQPPSDRQCMTVLERDSLIGNIAAQLPEAALVLRRGNDITSIMLAEMNIHDKRFSHMGICIRGASGPIVYHIVGAESGREDFIRKENVEDFFDAANNNAIGYAPLVLSDAELRRLDRTLYNWYRQRIPFDMSFDMSTDDSMYCSELVAKALKELWPEDSISYTDTLGLRYYAVDNVLAFHKVDSVRYFGFCTE